MGWLEKNDTVKLVWLAEFTCCAGLTAEHDQPRFAVRSAGNSLSARLPAVISQLRMATIAGASLVASGA